MQGTPSGTGNADASQRQSGKSVGSGSRLPVSSPQLCHLAAGPQTQPLNFQSLCGFFM